MSSSSSPPRFVPTLTDVVQASGYAVQVNAMPQSEGQLEDQFC